MSRHEELEQLYDGLAVFARRSRELSETFHPDLSLVAFSLLSFIQARENVRAIDIATSHGLDKSTVSRQIDRMVADGLLVRGCEQPGRRGNTLALTPAGEEAMATAATTIRAMLTEHLTSWSNRDITTFARLISTFNVDTADFDR